jgi:hypothetical protein
MYPIPAKKSSTGYQGVPSSEEREEIHVPQKHSGRARGSQCMQMITIFSILSNLVLLVYLFHTQSDLGLEKSEFGKKILQVVQYLNNKF